MKCAFRFIQRAGVAIMLAGAPVGCAALPAITQIASVVMDAMAILGIIDSGVSEWFKQHPNSDPAARARYLAAYQKALAALNAAQRALAGFEDIDQEQYDQAFRDFNQAYRELTELLATEGITRDNYLRVSADGPGVFIPPEPVALSYRVR